MQGGWCGSAAAADSGSGAAGRAAAAGESWHTMNPDGEEALYLPSGQEGCTDGTLTFLSGRQPINSKLLFKHCMTASWTNICFLFDVAGNVIVLH